MHHMYKSLHGGRNLWVVQSIGNDKNTVVVRI